MWTIVATTRSAAHVAVLTVAAWSLAGRPNAGIMAAVAVLVVACPCSLGLATPAGVLVGTGRGAALGVLFKGGDVLERGRAVDTIVFDKTGTLTEGRMTATEVIAGGASAGMVLRMAAAVESGSEHPVARAIVEEARRRTVEIPGG